MENNTIETTAPAWQEVPASETPVQSISDALAAGESISDDTRGAEKKKRNAVRKAFRSAGIDLLMEAAELLGIVKNTWYSGETKSICVDLTKFDPKAYPAEDVGLFLGFRDSVETFVKVSCFVMCSSGYVGIHAHMKDRAAS